MYALAFDFTPIVAVRRPPHPSAKAATLHDSRLRNKLIMRQSLSLTINPDGICLSPCGDRRPPHPTAKAATFSRGRRLSLFTLHSVSTENDATKPSLLLEEKMSRSGGHTPVGDGSQPRVFPSCFLLYVILLRVEALLWVIT